MTPAELGFFESYMNDALLLQQFTDSVIKFRLLLKDSSIVVFNPLPIKEVVTKKVETEIINIVKEESASKEAILTDREVLINDIKKTVNIASILKNYNKVKHLIKKEDIDLYKDEVI